MSLPLSYYLEHVPGVSAWLRGLDATGYMLGSSLAEGAYLQGDADGAVTAVTVLRLLESAGLIRRGEQRPSHSQLAFGALTLGGGKPERTETWYAWHPAASWRHPAFRAEQAPRVERCDWCDSGACWTHGKAVAP